ncbi:CYTH domain-containing protein [Candidatus Woesearchaeota archaeon]|nr:CYTH domain-containing protein [Candidatus Woesearchaeota archaeon]
MGMGDGREVEAKFIPREAQIDALRKEHVKVSGFEIKLSTTKYQRDTYYDTPRMELTPLGAVCRVREIGGCVLVAFKADLDEGRDGIVHKCLEEEEEIESDKVRDFLGYKIQNRPYAALRSFMELNRLEGALQELLRCEDYRRDQRVYSDGTTLVEVSVDELVFQRNDRRVPSMFVESEFKGGDYEQFKGFCSGLKMQFDLKICQLNKVQIGVMRLMTPDRND